MADRFDDEDLEIDEVERKGKASEWQKGEKTEGFAASGVEAIKGNEEDRGVIAKTEKGERDAEDLGIFATKNGITTAAD